MIADPTTTATFALYTALALFAARFVPETRNRSLEQIERDLLG